MINSEQLRTADEDSAAFVEIKDQFDAYSRSELHPAKLVTNLAAICKENPEVTWDALSLLDQHHRRGLLSADAFANAKKSLNAIAFGVTAAGNRPSGESNGANKTHASDTDRSAVERSSPARTNDGENTETRQTGAEIRSPEKSPEKLPEKLREMKAAVKPAAKSSLEQTTQEPSQVLKATSVLAGRYVLMAPIYSTPTTTVFKAYDRQRLELPEAERFVSIKGASSLDALPEVRALLQREFVTAKDLSHPNILGTYDYRADSENCFLVQEYFPGQVLRRVIERVAPRRILQSQALAVVREAGLALAYAHESNKFHGDVTVDTIAIGPNGDVRIFGFGSGANANAILPQPLDARDDIFGLACVAYELMTGDAAYVYAGSKLDRRWTRIKTISRRQWDALESALRPQRARRPAQMRAWMAAFIQDDADAFLPSFEHVGVETPRQRSWFAATMKFAAAVAVVAVLGYALMTGKFALPVKPVPNDEPTATVAKEAEATQTVAVPANNQTAKAATAPVAATKTSEATRMPKATAPFSNDLKGEQKAALVADALAASPSRLSFTADRFTVSSNESVARLTLTRRGSNSKEVIVNWKTVPGTAKPDQDYAATAEGELRIAAGERSAAILVPIVHGEAQEKGSKWFEVELTQANNATLNSISSAVVNIVSAE